MPGVLSEDTLAGLCDHRAAFGAAKPYRHIVIDGFFDPEVAAAMVRDFPAFEDQSAINELGLVGEKAVHDDMGAIGGIYSTIDDALQQREFLGAIERVSGIEGLLYDPHYVGGGTHENLSGQGLDPHVDFNYHPIRQWHRRLNLIVYLNDEWEPGWGGTLALHRDPWADDDEVVEVAPRHNRAVLFETTERSWHGFEPIGTGLHGEQLSRRSFAVYFYSRERPSSEVHPPHTTHYVPRRLPEHLQPGRILDEADLATIESAIEQRNQWIRFLYEREMQLSARLTREMQGQGWLMVTTRRLARELRSGGAIDVVAPRGSRRRSALIRARGRSRRAGG